MFLIFLVMTLRACGECGAMKSHVWYDIDPNLCNTCSRMTEHWQNSEEVFPPIIQPIVQDDIDWSCVTCPLCGCRVFMEECTQYRAQTNSDGFPCCAWGVSPISIQWPPDAALAAINNYSKGQWRTANQVSNFPLYEFTPFFV